MKKLFLIIILFQNLIFSQNPDEHLLTETISDKIQTYCFESLKPLKEIDSIPAWRSHSCSILDNLVLFQIKTENKSFDEKLNKSVLSRLCEISNLFYLNKTPVILTSGMDSFYEADKKNKNPDDEDNIIYVSIGECTMPRNWYEAKDVFNSETMKLIQNK